MAWKPKASFFSHLARHFCRDPDSTRLRKLLQTGSDVDTLAKTVVALYDYLAEIYTDAHPDLLVFRQACIAFDKAALQRNGAFDCIDDRGKVGKKTIAHQLEDEAVMPGDSGLK